MIHGVRCPIQLDHREHLGELSQLMNEECILSYSLLEGSLAHFGIGVGGFLGMDSGEDLLESSVHSHSLFHHNSFTHDELDQGIYGVLKAYRATR